MKIHQRQDAKMQEQGKNCKKKKNSTKTGWNYQKNS